MKKMKVYEADDKMLHLIRDNYAVLQSLGAFGISLGFGNKTVQEVCAEENVDAFTFLAVVNLTINGYHSQNDLHHIHPSTLLQYLRKSHEYYLGFQLPYIRKELVGALDSNNGLTPLILKIFDEYAHFITHHMRLEEKTLFPYVDGLIRGERLTQYDVETFSKHHEQTSDKLRELKSIIIKYLPSDTMHNNILTATLYDIFNLEESLTLHASVEERILWPTINMLERNIITHDMQTNLTTMLSQQADNGDALSEREKDIVRGVVQGLTNKEIADHLFISTNTVMTHRRNIAKKLQIHSSAGLTIYAIVNKLVDLSSIQQ